LACLLALLWRHGQLQQAAALHVARAPAQQPLGGRVPRQHVAIGRVANDGVVCAVHYRGGLRPLGGERDFTPARAKPGKQQQRQQQACEGDGCGHGCWAAQIQALHKIRTGLDIELPATAVDGHGHVLQRRQHAGVPGGRRIDPLGRLRLHDVRQRQGIAAILIVQVTQYVANDQWRHDEAEDGITTLGRLRHLGTAVDRQIHHHGALSPGGVLHQDNGCSDVRLAAARCSFGCLMPPGIGRNVEPEHLGVGLDWFDELRHEAVAGMWLVFPDLCQWPAVTMHAGQERRFLAVRYTAREREAQDTGILVPDVLRYAQASEILARQLLRLVA
jgi:hypothetical protein